MYSFPLGGPEFIQNTDHLRRWLNRVWGIVIRWEHSFATHQQLLVVLLERVLPHLDKPLLLTDYLMDSLDMGKQLLQSEATVLLYSSSSSAARIVIVF
jgi:hypothetical protein